MSGLFFPEDLRLWSVIHNVLGENRHSLDVTHAGMLKQVIILIADNEDTK